MQNPQRIIIIAGPNGAGNNPDTQSALDGRFSLLQLGGGAVLLSYYRLSILKGDTTEGGLNVMYKK